MRLAKRLLLKPHLEIAGWQAALSWHNSGVVAFKFDACERFIDSSLRNPSGEIDGQLLQSEPVGIFGKEGLLLNRSHLEDFRTCLGLDKEDVIGLALSALEKSSAGTVAPSIVPLPRLNRMPNSLSFAEI